ncbi:hypothetical protein HYH03_010887 [Edaphochlamys debaryana]|uniref:Uncharacterized protein n=1 Tax=Edaphochlamys debaryana TaxID=47281 RepID=A0A835XYG4_9CHLO|nr:hypothetical protein HYH03_010887 [Edaphochlamys debaryana]|eukprot:KAG2490731.1 hypothetical protein HYH03_010887 [Edaphochlamys debaryana]
MAADNEKSNSVEGSQGEPAEYSLMSAGSIDDNSKENHPDGEEARPECDSAAPSLTAAIERAAAYYNRQGQGLDAGMYVWAGLLPRYGGAHAAGRGGGRCGAARAGGTADRGAARVRSSRVVWKSVWSNASPALPAAGFIRGGGGGGGSSMAPRKLDLEGEEEATLRKDFGGTGGGKQRKRMQEREAGGKEASTPPAPQPLDVLASLRHVDPVREHAPYRVRYDLVTLEELAKELLAALERMLAQAEEERKEAAAAAAAGAEGEEEEEESEEESEVEEKQVEAAGAAAEVEAETAAGAI